MSHNVKYIVEIIKLNLLTSELLKQKPNVVEEAVNKERNTSSFDIINATAFTNVVCSSWLDQ